jgi:glycosyltransferase involved in cell wall biosynthesis
MEELLALKKRGVHLTIFSLKNPTNKIFLDGTPKELITDVFYSPFFFSWDLLKINLYQFLSHPLQYLGFVISLIRRLIFQPIELFKTLSIIPKTIVYASIAKQRNCNRVHAHFCTVPFVSAKIIAAINQCEFSVTAHGFDIHQNPPADIVRRIVEASPFITISEFNKKFLTRLATGKLKEQIKIVHCGIDLSKFEFIPRQLPSSRPINIIVVARLEWVKGIDILINALNILKEKGFHYQCRIIGDGTEHAKLTKQIHQLNLQNSVHLHGSFPHPDVIRALNQSDLFILPSRMEGIPVSVMEAIASGLPVITTKISGLGEIISSGITGLLVPPENPEAIADSVLQLMQNSDLYYQFSISGREKIEKEFNIESSVDLLLDLWST